MRRLESYLFLDFCNLMVAVFLLVKFASGGSRCIKAIVSMGEKDFFCVHDYQECVLFVKITLVCVV